MSGDNNVVSPTKANKLQDKEGSIEGQEEEEWKQLSDGVTRILKSLTFDAESLKATSLT